MRFVNITEPQFSKLLRFAEKLFSLAEGDLISKKRHRHIVEIRQVCYYLMYKKGITYARIGRLFNRDHTTIMYGNKIAKDILIPIEIVNPCFTTLVDGYLEFLIKRKDFKN